MKAQPHPAALLGRFFGPRCWETQLVRPIRPDLTRGNMLRNAGLSVLAQARIAPDGGTLDLLL